MAYINIELDEFDDQELIDELQSRGYYVEDGEYIDENLTLDEKELIMSYMIAANKKPGSMEYDIYEKLRKR